ncbi:glycerophosphodiester phosphodiesterase family protein [Tenggerimyces flavus]|uniref:Glycerophosphodiester phosphodiesterase family protein n=1 Tax=Tenggerimyces flavus TaxID=1708749 RepID=A0ABV7Y559_9ACTN|nr:glycerophosphodiester phosphodiesterase family protein [Tenggerimyces flavus]MBM7791295.1 glycerophosphoryl diester phosphodiesterase [Tenggerimyces flavus]
MSKRRVAAVVVAGLLVLAWVANTSLLASPPDEEPRLLAHRGMAQTFDLAGVENDTCTAERIHPPEHPYLENTIASMRAAFDAGADVVELDLQPTKDERFAVFHDWTVDCRTNGNGVTRDHTLDELRKLDVGYGYTADGGKTFPFRGKGIGLMPTLDEVLETFDGKNLLLHVKSDDPSEGRALGERLAKLPPDRRARLAVYGGDRPIAELAKRLPDLRVMSKATMKACLLPYLGTGWSGYVPKACRHTQLHLPDNLAPWLWGWPNRFLERMKQADTYGYLVRGGDEFSGGFDSAADLERLPDGYTGGIWTNRIDRIEGLTGARRPR